jgi:hypothetical protein
MNIVILLFFFYGGGYILGFRAESYNIRQIKYYQINFK